MSAPAKSIGEIQWSQPATKGDKPAPRSGHTITVRDLRSVAPSPAQFESAQEPCVPYPYQSLKYSRRAILWHISECLQVVGQPRCWSIHFELTLANAVPKHGISTQQINTRHTTHAHTYPCPAAGARPINPAGCLHLTYTSAAPETGSACSGPRLCAAALRRRRSVHSPPPSKKRQMYRPTALRKRTSAPVYTSARPAAIHATQRPALLPSSRVTTPG